MMGKLYFILFFLISFNSFGQFNTEPVKKEISIYPNPAKSTLWINIDNKDIRAENISVYNIIGHQLPLQASSTEEGRFTIDINDLPSGYYLLVVEKESIQYAKTIKFLKK